jgi:hypothetical protein
MIQGAEKADVQVAVAPPVPAGGKYEVVLTPWEHTYNKLYFGIPHPKKYKNCETYKKYEK